MSTKLTENTSESPTSTAAASCCAGGSHKHAPAASVPPQTKLQKTQSLLTTISYAVGLLGIAGSVFSYGIATFYTGAVDIKPSGDVKGIVVKVYTKEGHESVFHARHIELMPGQYHLEITSPDGKVVHAEPQIEFHKTVTLPVSFAEPAPSPASSMKIDKKHHWWQFWKHGSDVAEPENQTEADNLDQ